MMYRQHIAVKIG